VNLLFDKRRKLLLGLVWFNMNKISFQSSFRRSRGSSSSDYLRKG
jgi:hypothetical protein